MSKLQDALDKIDDWLPDILDQREPDRYKEWFMEAYATVAEAARRIANLDNQGLRRETETTCRRCRDQGVGTVHDWDSYESSERWVTDWQELPDPALGITTEDT